MHSKRLRNGVKELIRTQETTLEDLHMVATDVIATLDKLAERTVRKLRSGQSIRVYDEDSNKEYGQKGADVDCFFLEAYDTKIRGTTLKVYDAKNEWTVPLDCLLAVSSDFDPESEEGKRRSSKGSLKRKGRRSKAEADSMSEAHEFDTQWSSSQEVAFEPEEPGEEYDFNNSSNWGDFFENE